MRAQLIAADMARVDGVDTAAQEATRLLVEAAFAFWGHFVARAAELGLAPTQAHALMVIEPSHPATMRDVAESLSCDPSTITGVADRLEAHGLVERQSQAGDRRVRTLALTRAGEERREQLLARLAQPPASVSTLDQRQLGALVRLLGQIMAAEAEGAAAAARCLPRAAGASQ
jgi:DNA-binding MarR family transcriptional regulator